MSLVITTYVPEGIVMTSDSRWSITIEGKAPDGKDLPKIDTVSSDNAYKTYLPLKKRSKPRSSQTFFKGVWFLASTTLSSISAGVL
jgi:hypothetical protein